MSLLDSLLLNMADNTRGVSQDRFSFLNETLDESCRRWVSKSVSKPPLRVSNKQTLQATIRAIYKLSMLINKKLKSTRLSFFVNLQEHTKTAVIFSRSAKSKEGEVEFLLQALRTTLHLNKSPTEQRLVQVFNSERCKPDPDTPGVMVASGISLTLAKMNASISVIFEKHYRRLLLAQFFGLCKHKSESLVPYQQGLSSLHNLTINANLNNKLYVVTVIKQLTRQVDAMDLFVSLLKPNLTRTQTYLTGLAFYSLTQNSPRDKPTEESFTLSQSPRCLQLSRLPSLNQIQMEIQSSLSTATNCSGASKISPKTSPSLAQSTVLASNRCVISLPKQQDRFLFFGNNAQRTPKQLHRLHPDKLSCEFHDIGQSLQIFDKVRYPLEESNRGSGSRSPSVRRMLSKTTRAINLKTNCFAGSSKNHRLFCTPRKQSREAASPEFRKSFGLKSSRTIKEFCVGGDWERAQMGCLGESGLVSPPKEPWAKQVPTLAHKKTSSISIARTELFSRERHGHHIANKHKKLPTFCSQFLNKLRN